MSYSNVWTNTRHNTVHMTKEEEQAVIDSMPEQIKQWRKEGRIIKMEKINNYPTREEVVNFTPSRHSFCHSGLHW